MIFDDLGWFMMIFRNHDFFKILPDICHVHHLEESASHPLPLLEGVPQVWREDQTNIYAEMMFRPEIFEMRTCIADNIYSTKGVVAYKYW